MNLEFDISVILYKAAMQGHGRRHESPGMWDRMLQTANIKIYEEFYRKTG